MANGNELTREEHILLEEYQACEQDNAANFQGFWTLAAIFLGLSSAFLAGLIYAIIANKAVLNALLSPNKKETIVIGIVAVIISIANIVVLCKIRGWHRRVMFNQGLNLLRMREIEVKLGMRRSLRSRAVDSWKELEKELDKIAKKGNNLDELKKELCEFGRSKRRSKEYEPQSSRKHFPCILHIMTLLWGVLIGAMIIATANVFLELLWSVIIGIVASTIIVIWDHIVFVRSKFETHQSPHNR